MTFESWFRRHYRNYTVPGGMYPCFKQKMRACWKAAQAAKS